MQLLILLLSTLPTYSATFEGYSALRHLIQDIDDGLNTKNAQGKDSSHITRKQYSIRAGLRAKGEGEGEKKVSWTVGVRTTSSATSDWITVQGGGDRAIGIETALLKYTNSSNGNIHAQMGRAPSIFIYDSLSQMLWDKDTRWDGLALQWDRDIWGLNLSYYVLGARNAGVFGASTYSRTEASDADANTQGGMGAMAGAQAFYRWKTEGGWKGSAAVGRYQFTGAQGSLSSGAFQNTIHGGTAGTVGNVNPVIMDNARQWHFYADVNWELWKFIGEFVRNKKVFYGTRTTPTENKAQSGALALSLVYGNVKEAYGYQVSYSYVRKGLSSVVGTFTNSSMPPDNLGHLVDAKFAVAKNFNVGAKWELFREKAKKGGDGLPSNPSSRFQKSRNWEFYSGVSF